MSLGSVAGAGVTIGGAGSGAAAATDVSTTLVPLAATGCDSAIGSVIVCCDRGGWLAASAAATAATSETLGSGAGTSAAGVANFGVSRLLAMTDFSIVSGVGLAIVVAAATILRSSARH